VEPLHGGERVGIDCIQTEKDAQRQESEVWPSYMDMMRMSLTRFAYPVGASYERKTRHERRPYMGKGVKGGASSGRITPLI